MSDISINAANTAPPGTVSPGVALSAARRAQNLSIEDVARQLRLSVSQVKALEADAYEHLPSPVFVRGFIRNYARVLRMDADALLKDATPGEPVAARRAFVPLTRENQYPPVERSRLHYYVVIVLALVAALGWYEFQLPESGRDSTTPVSAPVVTREPASTVTPVNVPAVPPAETPAPVAGSGVPSATRVHLQFIEASWVDVRDRSGAVLLSQTQPAGSERTLDSSPPYSLVIGNARAVRLSHNDVPKDLAPYTINNVARLMIE